MRMPISGAGDPDACWRRSASSRAQRPSLSLPQVQCRRSPPAEDARYILLQETDGLLEGT
jgi:hypothetical protein